MTDQEGNPVENANNRIKVKVTGEGRLIGLDNGDSTDYDSYKGSSRKLFSGKLLAMIETSGREGIVQIELSEISQSEGVLHEEKSSGISAGCDLRGRKEFLRRTQAGNSRGKSFTKRSCKP